MSEPVTFRQTWTASVRSTEEEDCLAAPFVEPAQHWKRDLVILVIPAEPIIPGPISRQFIDANITKEHW
jgi:hypothetical protein